jgi:hypothetical protein
VPDIDTKRCTKCGDDKPHAEFYSNSSKPDGLHNRCKSCERERPRSGSASKEPDLVRLSAMAPWGTAFERGLVTALAEAGSLAAAAERAGITPREFRGHLAELERRAASRGWAPEHDMKKTTPDGYHVKGVSTYYGAKRNGREVVLGEDGAPVMEPRGQWVKTQRDAEQKYAALVEAVQGIAEPFRGAADPVTAPAIVSADYLNVIPLGDPHLGMYAWAQETGNDFDLAIAEGSLVAAVDHLIALAPPAEECLIIDLGDFFHSDTSENRTARSGHALDVDTRWSKVLLAGIRTMRRCIDRALEKHKRVRVIVEIGNHDDHSSVMLALCLANYYEREPRVIIDTSPAKFHWHRFGKVLIGVTHGDTVKPDKLGPIMACDRPQDWGETLHRYWYTGHVHHDSLKEYPGVIVETFRTLAARDAWHHAAGYRSGRDLKLDVIHREHGRVNRHIVGITQVWPGTPEVAP